MITEDKLEHIVQIFAEDSRFHWKNSSEKVVYIDDMIKFLRKYYFSWLQIKYQFKKLYYWDFDR